MFIGCHGDDGRKGKHLPGLKKPSFRWIQMAEFEERLDLKIMVVSQVRKNLLLKMGFSAEPAVKLQGVFPSPQDFYSQSICLVG